MARFDQNEDIISLLETANMTIQSTHNIEYVMREITESNNTTGITGEGITTTATFLEERVKRNIPNIPSATDILNTTARIDMGVKKNTLNTFDAIKGLMLCTGSLMLLFFVVIGFFHYKRPAHNQNKNNKHRINIELFEVEECLISNDVKIIAKPIGACSSKREKAQNSNYRLSKKESTDNRRLFGFQGIGNDTRKNTNRCYRIANTET